MMIKMKTKKKDEYIHTNNNTKNSEDIYKEIHIEGKWYWEVDTAFNKIMVYNENK